MKAGIRRAARAVGIEPGLAKRLWYGEVRRVDAELMDPLRRAAGASARREASLEYGTLLARTIMGFAAWLTVLIAPWIKDAER